MNIIWYVANVSFSNATPRENLTIMRTPLLRICNTKCIISYLTKIIDYFWNSSTVHRQLTTKERFSQQLWAQEGCRCKGYMEYLFPFQNKRSDRGGSRDFKISQRYCEDVEASTRILKCNVWFYVNITYVMLILCYEW